MIRVTRLDGSAVFINERNIQWIESLPDTTLTLIGGVRVILRDSLDSVLERVFAAEQGIPTSGQESASVSVREQ